MRIKKLTAAFLLVMFAAVLVVEPLPVHAASSLVQQNSTLCIAVGGNPFPGLTISASFSSNGVSGNVIVVAVASADASWNPPATVASVGDSRGSSFTQAVYASHGDKYAYIYYAMLSSSGPDTVTVTFSSDLSDENGYAYLFIYEVSGVTTGGSTATGSGIISSSGSVATSSTNFESGAFLVAIMASNILSSDWVAGSSFQFSPTPNGDQFIRLSRGMYSTSGVSSPTNFPATLSKQGDTLDWVEVGIALNPPSTLSAEDPITHLNTLDVKVGSSFSVDIWIRNIPSGDPIANFAFDLGWDPALMQYDHSQENPPNGWKVNVDNANAPLGALGIGGSMLQNGNPYGDDHMWLSVYFRCLKSGVGTIKISDSSYLGSESGNTGSFNSVLNAKISQTEGSTPGPVGGVVLPTSKLEIVAPFAALAGLIVAVSTAVVVKKRRD